MELLYVMMEVLKFVHFLQMICLHISYHLIITQMPKPKSLLNIWKYVVPEKEARMVIAEYIAYVFAKHLRWEKCMVLYGSGCNGKSVLIDVISALLGKTERV